MEDCVETNTKERQRIGIRNDSKTGFGSKTLARLICLTKLGLPLDYKGGSVCHRCGNERCINPEHLYLGTQKDNIEDAKRHGTYKAPGRRNAKFYKCVSPTGSVTFRLGIERAASFTSNATSSVSRSVKKGVSTKGWRFYVL